MTRTSDSNEQRTREQPALLLATIGRMINAAVTGAAAVVWTGLGLVLEAGDRLLELTLATGLADRYA